MSGKEKMELLLKKAADIGWSVVSDNQGPGFAFERGKEASR